MSDSYAHAFLVTGIVQGVGFRAYTRSLSRTAGLTGWVRNRPDGAVEGILQGPKDSVEETLHSLRSGPPHATVYSLDHKRVDLQDFETFAILRQ